MNRQLRPVQILLISGFFLLLVGLYAWANGESLKYLGAQALHKNNQDHVFISVGTDLLEFDPYRAYVAAHDLTALGVETLIGDILFVDNYTILVRKGAVETGLVDNIRAFLRLANTGSQQPSTPESGLFLCDLHSHGCERFTREPVDYDAVFSLARDPADGSIYLADSSRHRLIKYDATGVDRMRMQQGLKFPNGLLVTPDEVLLANTNHHQLSTITSEAHGLAQVGSIDVVPEEATLHRQIWPVDIEQVADQWWILNMQADMGHGGVYRFDDEWNYLGRLDIPENADPGDLLHWQHDEVLVSDPYNYTVYRFNTRGEKLSDFMPYRLSSRLADQQASREHYEMLSYLPVGVFIIALLVGLVMGVKAELAAAASRSSTVNKDPGPEVVPSRQLVWLEPNRALQKKLKRLAWAGMAWMVIAFATLFVVWRMHPEMHRVFQMGALLLLMIVVLYALTFFYFRQIFKTRIGVQGHHLVLVDHRGRQTTGPVSDAFDNGQSVVLNNVAVMYGNRRQSFFSSDSLQSNLQPLLKQAKRINSLKMLIRLYKLRHPYPFFMALVIVWALVMLLVTEFLAPA